MKIASQIIAQVSNEILLGAIVKNTELEGVILTGSYVHGNIHDQSDVDLIVVIDKDREYVRHITFWREGILFQIRIYPLKKFIKDCLIHDQKRPAIYACKVLYDRNGNCSDAIARSKDFLEKGPLKLPDAESLKDINTIKNEILTLEGLINIGNNIAANLLINELLLLLVKVYNNDNCLWMSNNNYLFIELGQNNAELGEQAEKIFFETDIHTKYMQLKQICQSVIKNFDALTGEYIYDEYY